MVITSGPLWMHPTCQFLKCDDQGSDIVGTPFVVIVANPVSLEKPFQASLPPDQQGRHSLGRHPEVQYVA